MTNFSYNLRINLIPTLTPILTLTLTLIKLNPYHIVGMFGRTNYTVKSLEENNSKDKFRFL